MNKIILSAPVKDALRATGDKCLLQAVSHLTSFDLVHAKSDEELMNFAKRKMLHDLADHLKDRLVFTQRNLPPTVFNDEVLQIRGEVFVFNREELYELLMKVEKNVMDAIINQTLFGGAYDEDDRRG